MKINNYLSIRKINISKLNEHDIADINFIINKSENATVFHTYEWNKVVYNFTNNKCWIIIVYEQKEPISLCYVDIENKRSFIRIAKSPNVILGSIYGGPISISGKEKINYHIINNISKIIKSKKYILVTHPHFKKPPSHPDKMNQDCIKTLIINLDQSEEQLYKNCTKKARWSIRKAKKQGVEVFQANEELVKEYHSMIEETFEGTSITPFSINYYKKIIQELLSKGIIKFIIAKYSNNYIAGAIFLCFNRTIYYWHGSSYRKYRHLCPNHLIQWEMISWANARGYKYYDMMIVEEERLPGIAYFKKSWGGIEEVIPRYHYEMRLYRLIRNIKRKVRRYQTNGS